MSSGEVRCGHIIILKDAKALKSMSDDASKVKVAFEKQNFKFVEDPVTFSKVDQLIEKVKEVTANMDERGLHLIYIIASTQGSQALDYGGTSLDVWEICEATKVTDARKMIFLQFYHHKDEDGQGILLNVLGPSSGDGKGVSPNPLLPYSTDMLLAYLPRTVGQGLSVVDFLCEELQQSQDLDECLVSVTRRTRENKGSKIPIYSSTMRRRISLQPEAVGKRALATTSGKVLTYQVENFGEFRRKFNLKETELTDFNLQKNVELISSAFGNLGFEVNWKKGKVNANEILDSVYEIAADENKVPPVLAIAISTHGDEDGTLLASNDRFNLRGLLSKLPDLKSIPKLIIIDACRGGGKDRPPSIPQWTSALNPGKDFHLPLNTLLVMSSSKGNQSFCSSECGTFLMSCLCNKVCNLENGRELDLFRVLHDVMEKVAQMSIRTDPQQPIAKQQVTYASTLTRPLCFMSTISGH